MLEEALTDASLQPSVLRSSSNLTIIADIRGTLHCVSLPTTSLAVSYYGDVEAIQCVGDERGDNSAGGGGGRSE